MDDALLDEVAEFLDQSFENAVCQSTGHAARRQDDEAAVQDLFIQIAASYASPIRRFTSELKEGTATKEGIAICRPVLQYIMGAARKMNRNKDVRCMAAFDAILADAETSLQDHFGHQLRQQALRAYEELIDVLPEVFKISPEGGRREDVIIRELLKQIPGVGSATLVKLYRSGLSSLNSLLISKPDEVAVTTSIPLRLCERIFEKVQQYRTIVESLPSDLGADACRSCLEKLARELRHQEKEIERTLGRAGSKSALQTERQQRRQLRQRCNLQIMIILAELGEFDLIHKLQQLSFKRRIRKLEKYLHSKSGAQDCGTS